MIKLKKKNHKIIRKYQKIKYRILEFIHLLKKNTYIYILGIVKISKDKYKIIHIKNFLIDDDSYKGYFINEQETSTNITLNDFTKWYFVEEDYNGNLLYLYNEKEKISL